MTPPPPPGRRELALAALWLFALALAGVIARAGANPPRWVTLSAAVVSVAGAAAFFSGGRRVASSTSRWSTPLRGQHAAIALPIIVLASVATGALASPLLVIAAVCVLALAQSDVARAAMYASATLGSVAAMDVLRDGRVDPGAVVLAAAVLAGIGVLPAVRRRRDQEQIEQATLRAERLEAFFAHKRGEAARGDAGAAAASAGMSVHLPGAVGSDADVAGDKWQLANYLRDVRDLLGADEVVFWRSEGDDAEYRPAAWYTLRGDAPRDVSPATRRFIAWSVQEQMVHCIGEQDHVHLAIAPVIDDQATLLGALSMSSAAGFVSAKSEIKRWLPRFATQVAALADLLLARAALEHENRSTAAILNASAEFQNSRTLGDLAALIAARSLELTAGNRAALVRWHARDERGSVQGVTRQHVVKVGFEVSADSTVAECCRSGDQLVLESPLAIDRSRPVYGPGERQRAIGSIGIVPIQRDGVVTGAIVLEGDASHAVRGRDVQRVQIIGALAARALETLWEIEEAGKRAQTDALTGLGNRRFFDEHVERVLREADRSGATVALIVADVDHFKAVNDNYGHDAGDAILQRVAATLGDVVRTSDLLARFGGEEFAILLPNTHLTGACELAERLRRAVELRVATVGGRQIPVTASFGVASYPETAKSKDDFFPAADKALYRAKKDGRNKVRSAEPSVEATGN